MVPPRPGSEHPLPPHRYLTHSLSCHSAPIHSPRMSYPAPTQHSRRGVPSGRPSSSYLTAHLRDSESPPICHSAPIHPPRMSYPAPTQHSRRGVPSGRPSSSYLTAHLRDSESPPICHSAPIHPPRMSYPAPTQHSRRGVRRTLFTLPLRPAPFPSSVGAVREPPFPVIPYRPPSDSESPPTCHSKPSAAESKNLVA